MDSRKRVFVESTEPEVIEIDPPLVDRVSNANANAKGKQKEVAYHEIIDVDTDDDCDDVVVLDDCDDVVVLEGKIESNKKSLVNNAGNSDSNKVASNKKGKEIPVDPDHSFKGPNPGLSNIFYLDEDVFDDFDDEYLALQSHFDDIGLPAGIEAPVPWLPDLLLMKKEKSAIPFVKKKSRWGPEVSQLNKVDSMRAPTFYSSSKQSTAVGGPSTFFDPKPFSGHSNIKKIGSGNYLSDNSNTQVGNPSLSVPQLASKTAYPLGMDTPKKKWHELFINNMAYPHLDINTMDMLFENGDIYSTNDTLLDPDASVHGSTSMTRSSVESSSSLAKFLDGDVKKRYESFKKFDTVVDHSDHHFAKQSSEMTQPPKNWAKRIQEEWKILEKDLPDTIFVRVYESRMDLLRAAIIGAEGTPYHDGLFFFDVCFPSSYPSTPPRVHYRSGGLRINPNLYNSGKVCLSLLNTWSGSQNEKWIPGTSTMLQVLVSIQGLILNMKPYFNEPGYANLSGSVHGEQSSLQYNENTLILSLKTMVYTMDRPPKNFEDLVIGHFQHHVRDILTACKAYTEGVQVGCCVKGGLQHIDEGNNSCSARFKHDVLSYIKTLIAAFEKIGAKEAQEFLYLSAKETSLPAAPGPVPGPAFSPFPGSAFSSFPGSAFSSFPLPFPFQASYKPTSPSDSSHGSAYPYPSFHYNSISSAYNHQHL